MFDQAYKQGRKRSWMLCLWMMLGLGTLVAQVPDTFANPILPGFHPDPSICRVGDTYYLVNSSFEWYPGLPIYESKDLVNWQLIGYGIDRPDQVVLPEGLPDSRGVYAPTIRYHEGLFYLINTCVKCDGNFYLTAKDPAGPWSDPVWLGSRGIDPSLFWENGKCYYLGHANISGKADWPNKNGAWMQELDLHQEKLVGPRKQLTHGHATNARWTEGPHLYKIQDKYLLLVAEGGTGFHHAVTIHQSDSLWGPYVPIHANPVFTHRHLGSDYPIHSVGHADLIQTQNGDWWAVTLAKRKQAGHTLLSRESFLTPVRIEQQEDQIVPVFNPGIGHLEESQTRPDLPWTPFSTQPVRDEFDGKMLGKEWNCLRSPQTTWWSLDDGALQLRVRPEVVDSLSNPSFWGKRISDWHFSVATRLFSLALADGEQAGMILYRNSQNHVQFHLLDEHIQLIVTEKGKHTVLFKQAYPHKEVVFQLDAKDLQTTFRFGPNEMQLTEIPQSIQLTCLTDEVAGGFNGPYVGIYTSSNGQPSSTTVSFDWFEYEGKD